MENKRNVTRITGGIWKRTPVPIYSDNLVRPTPSRVRETVFNWIRQDLQIHNCSVLDLFCGSGVLGLEALSRGAVSACFVDQNIECLNHIKRLLSRLKSMQRVELINEDVSIWLQSRFPTNYDLIFLDPPFSFNNPGTYFSLVKPFVKKNGLIYLEKERSKSISLDSGVECWKSARAGIIEYGLYRIL